MTSAIRIMISEIPSQADIPSDVALRASLTQVLLCQAMQWWL